MNRMVRLVLILAAGCGGIAVPPLCPGGRGHMVPPPRGPMPVLLAWPIPTGQEPHTTGGRPVAVRLAQGAGGAEVERSVVLRGISPFDQLIRESARTHGLDWRLMAAVAFHESGFDPRVSSSAGAVGLMQVLPTTASAMGFPDPWEPSQNIEAGTRYLRWLYDIFSGSSEPDRVSLALASYTAGLGHVLDACSLAAAHGLNPAIWEGHVEEVMARLTNPVYASEVARGGVMGHRAVAFVTLVMRTWREYTGSAFPQP